jgi:hypothetical protein
MFRNLDNSAYDTFDPDMYDPTILNKMKRNNANGSGAGAGSTTQSAASVGTKMQVNLVLNNPTTVNLTFEMFCNILSAVKILQTAYVSGNYHYVPLLSYQGLAATVAGTGGTIGFNQLGGLEIHGNDATPDPIATISCTESTYLTFFEASAIAAFQVAYFRFNCQTDQQISNQITWFKKTFAGGISTNTINPRSYMTPNQQQNRLINITVSFSIGLDSGLSMVVNAGETVQLSLFINAWTRQTLNNS